MKRNDIKVRIHRVHTGQPLEPGKEVTIDGQAAHYLGRVLRLTVKDAVVLFNGDGHDYATDWVRAEKGAVRLCVTSRLPAVRESPVSVTVVQAISRGERMDQTLQKCTELGAAGFQPLVSERVEVKVKADKLEKRMAHWQGVVVSACEQSGRAVVPLVRPPLDFQGWLGTDAGNQRLVLAPGAPAPLAQVPVRGLVEIVTGPEGGFSESEFEQMVAHGAKPVSLGPRILRTETAAPAAMAVIQALAGDFA
jgi:16S rRNA (uracil1498-N3)-methyltransferase